MKMSPARKAPWLVLALLAGPALLAGEAAKRPASFLAPELATGTWLNVPSGTAPTLASRKGKVTIVHFWTYGCINCRRNLPIYDRWQERYASKGMLVIGIHTPETEAEAKPANVGKRVKELGITYPVLLDPARYNWRRWHQGIWPAIYLVDKQGRARYLWEGELEYKGAGGEAKMAGLIESLLKE